MDYQPPPLRSGTEPFTSIASRPDLRLHDFWLWVASDLLSNTLRGQLAEFIVASALGCTSTPRTEWDDVDLRLPNDGPTIEVKSAAYLQSWTQSKPSTIRFGIAPTQGWDAETNEYTAVRARRADVYVFCLLGTPGQLDVDPLNLDDWRFFVLATAVLDESLPDQKTLGLSPLLALEPVECSYEGISHAVATAIQ